MERIQGSTHLAGHHGTWDRRKCSQHFTPGKLERLCRALRSNGADGPRSVLSHRRSEAAHRSVRGENIVRVLIPADRQDAAVRPARRMSSRIKKNPLPPTAIDCRVVKGLTPTSPRCTDRHSQAPLCRADRRPRLHCQCATEEASHGRPEVKPAPRGCRSKRTEPLKQNPSF